MAALGAVTLVLSGCAESSPSAAAAEQDRVAPAVVLVTMDTTRADRTGPYGYEPAETPYLDALASQGTVFERALAVAPITLPSHVSMLTGTYPCSHGIRDNSIFTLSEDSRLVSEVLAERGWRTGAFVGAFVLDARFGLAQGFERYGGTPQPRSGPPQAERTGAEVTDDALRWLSTVRTDEPFFLWVHYFDPHRPYDTVEGEAGPEDAYDREITYVDRQIGRVLEALERVGRLDDTLTIVTADHGESLGEHGEDSHGLFVYDATLHVPMIVAGPGVEAARVAAPVSIADVAPTILHWLDIDASELPDCRVPSLLTTAAAPNGGAEDRALYFESFLPFYSKRLHPQQGVSWRDWKLIQTRRSEVYDVRTDPRELDDLIGQDAERDARLRDRLSALLTEHGLLGLDRGRSVSDQERERLQALGYVAGEPGAVFEADLPDVKDHITDLVAANEAYHLLREGRRLLALDAGIPHTNDWQDLQAEERILEGRAILTEARDTFADLARRHPDDVSYRGHLATCEMSLGNLVEATTQLEALVRAEPRSAKAHFQLGLCYADQEQWDWAKLQMEKAVSAEPRFGTAIDWLVGYHESAGEMGRAAWWRSEQERSWAGPPQGRESLEVDRRRLASLANDAGQDVAGPEEFPRDDLTPASASTER